MSEEQTLERFHRALIEEIQTQRPEYLIGPFTVAEIYQNLVPYGSHRDRIGVEMNGDYEDALLRLLAGEGGFLILESEPALRDIKAELQTPNPNTGLYREFAAVDVRLNQARLDLSDSAIEEMSDLAEALDGDLPVPMTELAPADAGLPELSIVPPGVDIFEGSSAPHPQAETGIVDDPASEEDVVAEEFPEPLGGLQPEFVEPESPTGASEEGGERCVWCQAPLPDRPNLNFCPFCGTDLKLVPCAECGEELEPEWRFCVACGTGTGVEG